MNWMTIVFCLMHCVTCYFGLSHFCKIIKFQLEKKQPTLIALKYFKFSRKKITRKPKKLIKKGPLTKKRPD
jgi:hypothetical protein